MRSRHRAIALVAGAAVIIVTGAVSVPVVWAGTVGPGTATVACTAPAWAEGTAYAAGDQVSYQGHRYQARVAHTPPPGAGWTPAAVPALWQDLGTCSGGPPSPTQSPSPTPHPSPSPSTAPSPSTSPSPSAPPPGSGDDLACGRAVSASSNNDTAGNAVDCVAGTLWRSSTDNPQQLQVDLGQLTVIDRITVVWGAGYGTSWKVRTSPDGARWSTVVAGSSGGGTQTLTLPPGTSTRWVQLYLSQYAGNAGFTIDELEIFGPPAPTTSPKPTSSPSIPPTGNGHTWNVSDADGLSAALAVVSPGDTIGLAPGNYDGTFYTTRSGTASEPITLTGPASAVLSNSQHGCDPNVPASPGGISYCGYGLHLNQAAHWHLTGFTVTDSAKGIVLDGSSHNTIDHVEVYNIGDEGVHFRASSSDNLLAYSRIHDTGREQPGYGEGLYLGSAKSNWAKYGANGGTGMDLSNDNQAIGNTFGPNITAEHIDIKEGTTGGLIQGNTFDGQGISGDNSADSWVDVKGNGYTIVGNHGSFTNPGTFADGYQTHQIVAPYGCGNVWRDNDSDLGGVGDYAIHVTNQSKCAGNLNVVYDDNTVSGAVVGLTNIGVIVGG